MPIVIFQFPYKNIKVLIHPYSYVHDLIKFSNGLTKLLIHETADFGWLSEETKDSSDRLKKEFVSIVDPLDVTKEYGEK